MDMRRLLISLVVCSCSSVVWAGETLNVKAGNVTGWNRYLGMPRYQWDFLPSPLDLAGANTVGEYDPGSNTPLPLTGESPSDTILATIADPFLEVVFPPFDVDTALPEAINVPIRDVETMVAGDLVTRRALPFITDAPVTAQSQSTPVEPDPITLGDWLQASGRMRVRCFHDGTAALRIRVRDLVPHRAYTVWAMWYLSSGRIFPQPFGGAPNGYITDEDGNADYRRTLNFCPMIAAREGIDGSRLLSIITHLHSDHVLYGAVPVPSGAGLPPGTVGHMQLEWNFPGAGVRLLDLSDDSDEERRHGRHERDS